MTYKSKSLAVFGALMLATTASPALAQTGPSNTADPYASTAPANNDDNGDKGLWGLLGLLGLAGLLGLKRRDRDDDLRRSTTGTTTRP